VSAVILGPMADENLRRALFLSDGSLMPLLTRPISPILTTVILATLFGSIVGLLRGPRHGSGLRPNAGVKP